VKVAVNGSERRRALILAATYAVLVIALLVGGGLYVRTLIAHSFQTAADLSTTRALAYSSLRYMLDEETGVRGYAATHNRLFLQPYNAALQPFATTLRTLRSDLTALKNSAALASVNDMGAANSDYLRTVASRLLNESGENTEAIERHGKNVVDRFRADVAHVDALLTLREQIVNREVQSAIDRIGLLTGGLSPSSS